MNTQFKGGAAAAASLVTLALASPAFGGAFALSERSAESQGTSFASANSGGTDVTFAGFNPAALSKVQGLEVGGNMSVLLVNANGSTNNPFLGGQRSNFDPSDFAVVPASAAGYRVTDDLVVGITINSPFGLRTDYPNNAQIFPGAGGGLESELITITATPMVSYNVLPELAIAIGPQFTWASATLSRAVARNGSTFAVGKLEGETFAYGFQAGVLWDPRPGTSLGFSYTHGYELDFDDGSFSVGGNKIPGTAAANIPGVFGFGARQKLDDDITIMADVRYFLWSAFDQITVDIPGLDATEITDYKDAVFAAVGIEGRVAPGLILRTGVAFDQTPTIDRTRSVRIPDADRFWWSVGASYEMNEHMSLDVGYSLLLAEETSVQAGGVIPSQINYDGIVHIISVGGSIKF